MKDAQIAPTSQYLPAVVPRFSLPADAPLAGGLREVALRQFDQAISPLVEADDVDRAVHGARKAMKRLRAMLRLVRPVIGNQRYRAENSYLRDTARVLSPLRDARVNLDTVNVLRERFDNQLRPTAFESVENELRARLERTKASMVHDGAALRRTAYSLRSARARFAAWPVVDDVVSGTHHPIASRYESVGVGLEMIYARGRDEMRTAIEHPTAHNFHWWRKRAKYLRYQTELLFPMWPDMMKGQANALDHLGEALGAEHDLAQLLLVLVQHPEVCPDPTERALLVALAQYRRRELQAAAVTIGVRVYAEKPGDFGKRMGVYWDAWMRERAAGIPIDPA